MRKFTSLLRKFRRCQQGSTAIILALSLVPVVLAAGMGLDFIRASNVKSRLQSALDAAALVAAASPSLTDDERIKLAKNAFAINWKNNVTGDIDVTPNFVIEKGTVKVSASGDMKTSLMRLAGVDNLDISGTTNITIPEAKKAEIALVLDYSGSMEDVSGGQVKYVAMKNAAKKLVNDLKATAAQRVKIGLVPFSHHVYVTLPKQFVKGQTGTGTWTGCTQDRLYPLNIKDTTPDPADDDTKWGQPIAPTDHGGCGAYAPNKLIVKPLSDDFTGINAQLDAMKPYAYTHIALGAEFGWHLLSPNAPFTGVADYNDPETDKIMVILTDGRQTEPSFGPNGVRNEEQGLKNLTSICNAAKAKGITIMTVAFQIEDDETRNRLRNCSTDPDKNFFIAEDGGDIASAFEGIRNQITASVFISK